MVEPVTRVLTADERRLTRMGNHKDTKSGSDANFANYRELLPLRYVPWLPARCVLQPGGMDAHHANAEFGGRNHGGKRTQRTECTRMPVTGVLTTDERRLQRMGNHKDTKSGSDANLANHREFRNGNS